MSHPLPGDPLSLFHPIIGQWFNARFKSPTSVQHRTWPAISTGEHLLITAPTGSGKTLTAFLWAIDRLLTGHWKAGGIRVLYVSPLRALNNDIERNLKQPLAEISASLNESDALLSRIRVQTRSGDTPQRERRAMLREPPEILITTPESLNILLTSKGGAALFDDLETVILDEIHAIAGSKRGTHLMTAVERLTRTSGEFQRIALSATVNPLEGIARFIGGYRQKGGVGDLMYEPRPVTIINASQKKEYKIDVCFKAPKDPENEQAEPIAENPMWREVAFDVVTRIEKNRSTLIFANSRRGVERLASLINSIFEAGVVFAHHGSLSREIREVVEERLKKGEVKGIVATNSLELGIDVGAIDEVLLLETPLSVAGFLQRIGRSGHGVGQTSQGRLYVIYGQDVVNGAVMAAALQKREVEPTNTPVAPLDVLAQVLLSMCAMEIWRVDELYSFLQQCAPYRHLKREIFDLVLEMLAGKYKETRLPALKPRILIDGIDGTVKGLPGVARLLYAAGGTIPDRGYYRLRLEETGAVIGELDEEFVWERKLGDIINLGVQSWRITDIGLNDVTVTLSKSNVVTQPFWTSEEQGTSDFFGNMRARFIENALPRLDDGAFLNELSTHHFLDDAAAHELIRFLKAQTFALGCDPSHRHHVVVENTSHLDPSRIALTLVHTEWGGQLNRPYAMALERALQERGDTLQVAHDDHCVAIAFDAPIGSDEIFQLVTSENVDPLVRQQLEFTGFFGARFRENSGRALLLPKAGFGRRTPLWLSRQRAKDLKTAVSESSDFPIVLETYRTCLNDEMDIPALQERLDEVATSQIKVTQVKTRTPSPFAQEVIWKITNVLMYEDDEPPVPLQVMDDTLIDQVVFSADLRPRIPKEVVLKLEEKLKRTYPGYAPRDSSELLSWLKERRIIPGGEWKELLAAMNRDHQVVTSELLKSLEERVVAISPSGDQETFVVVALEDVPSTMGLFDLEEAPRLYDAALSGDTAVDATFHALTDKMGRSETRVWTDDTTITMLSEWLRFYGPMSLSEIKGALGLREGLIKKIISFLIEDKQVVLDVLTEGATEKEVCHVENLRRLLRLAKSERTPEFTPRPIDELPLLFAHLQQLGAKGEQEALTDPLESLFGYVADAALWEEEILPSRLSNYQPVWLDSLMMGSNLEWQGFGMKQIAFFLSDDRELFSPCANEEEPSAIDDIFPQTPGRFSEADLLANAKGWTPEQITKTLWSLAWQGVITSETYDKVRRGVETGYHYLGGWESPRGVSRRFKTSRWRQSTPSSSAWYRLPVVADPSDALECDLRNRDRVRVLLDRYGVLFRELLQRESSQLQWRSLFPTLRLLELAGEIVGGYFFKGLSGVQFISSDALECLKQGLDNNRCFWINGADPASPAGLGVDGIAVPPRVTTTHLVYWGSCLVLVSKRRGKRLDIRVSPDDTRMPELLAFLSHLVTRSVRPMKFITVEEINGEPAATSPYRQHLDALFDTVADHRTVTISRKYL